MTKDAILDKCSLRILEVLSKGPLSSSELKEYVDVTWTTYSSRLKWLVRKGLVNVRWVERSTNERPHKVYSLTEKGRKFFELGKKLEKLLEESSSKDLVTVV
jgi:DNA-binding HxlR family transcriptional regulator